MQNINDLQPDYKAAAKFLGSLPTRDINVCAIWPEGDRPMASHSFMRNDAGIAGVEKFMAKYGSAGYGLYFYCNDLSVRLSKSKRADGKLVYKAKENEVARVNMLHVDLDPPDDTSPEDTPTVKAAMIARAQAYQPAPTIIVDSGNGLGLFWTLDKPIKVTPANRDKLKGYNKKLAGDLQGDSAFNLDRVMRIPFTVNIPNAPKIRRGRVPVIASIVLDMAGIEDHDIGAFTSAQVDAEAGAAVTSGSEYEQIGSPPIPTKVDLSRLDADLRTLIEDGAQAGADRSRTVYGVAAALRRIGWPDGAIIHVLTNADYMISDHIFDQKQRKPEDQAARIIMDMKTKKITAEPHAGETFDDESTRSARAEADDRLRSLRVFLACIKMTAENGCTEEEAAAHQAKAEDLQAKYQFTEEECLAAKYNDAQAGDSGSGATAGVHQPTTNPTPAETWFSIKRGFVYIGQQELFVRKDDGAMWKVQAFEKQFGYVRFGIPNPPASLTKYIFNLRPGYGLKTFDNFCFVPGAGENVDGSYNQFLPSTVVPAKGDTKLWDAHLEYLFPDEVDRGHVLNWMAWVYTHPTLHPNHALAVIGKTQGTGKSFLQRVLAKLLSSTAASPVSQKTLEAAHESWPLRTKLALIEVRSSTEKLSNILHDMVTGDTIHVDSKNVHDLDIPNVLAFWLESNKEDAIRGMDNSDRRYLIVSVDRDGAGLMTRGKDYYRKLYGRDGDGTGLIDDASGLGGIAYQLQTRDLGDYSGEDRAPDTSAKKLMQRRTASPLAKWMVEHAADKLRFRLVTIDDVIEELPQDLRTNYRGADSKPGDIRQDVGDILKLAPFYAESLGRMRAGADRLRLWYTHRAPEAKPIKEVYSAKELVGRYRLEHDPPKAAPADTVDEVRAEFAEPNPLA